MDTRGDTPTTYEGSVRGLIYEMCGEHGMGVRAPIYGYELYEDPAVVTKMLAIIDEIVLAYHECRLDVLYEKMKRVMVVNTSFYTTNGEWYTEGRADDLAELLAMHACLVLKNWRSTVNLSDVFDTIP